MLLGERSTGYDSTWLRAVPKPKPCSLHNLVYLQHESMDTMLGSLNLTNPQIQLYFKADRHYETLQE